MFRINSEAYSCMLTNKNGKVIFFSTSIPPKSIAVTDKVRTDYGQLMISQTINKRPDFDPIKPKDINGSINSVSLEGKVFIFESE